MLSGLIRSCIWMVSILKTVKLFLLHILILPFFLFLWINHSWMYTWHISVAIVANVVLLFGLEIIVRITQLEITNGGQYQLYRNEKSHVMSISSHLNSQFWPYSGCQLITFGGNKKSELKNSYFPSSDPQIVFLFSYIFFVCVFEEVS